MNFTKLEEARQWYEDKIAELRKTSYETGIAKCDNLLSEMKSFRIEHTVLADDDDYYEESWGREIGSTYSIATAKDIKDLIEEVEHIKDWMIKRSGSGQLNSSIDFGDNVQQDISQSLTSGITSSTRSASSLVDELPDLIDANILVFKNNEDNTLDIITLSSFDLRAKAPIRQGRNNILGYYRRDSEYIDLEGDYGNVEAVRTMELLNEMLP